MNKCVCGHSYSEHDEEYSRLFCLIVVVLIMFLLIIGWRQKMSGFLEVDIMTMIVDYLFIIAITVTVFVGIIGLLVSSVFPYTLFKHKKWCILGHNWRYSGEHKTESIADYGSVGIGVSYGTHYTNRFCIRCGKKQMAEFVGFGQGDYGQFNGWCDK